MYEQSMLLTDPGSGSTAPQTAFVLLPGTVGNNTFRRKVVGTGTNGLPITMDIKGEILPPAGARKYSVARVDLVFNETVSNDALFGSLPVAASRFSFNVPFGAVDTASIAWDDVAEDIRKHICWALQYLSGNEFSTTATTGEAAVFTNLVSVAGLSDALSGLADGVR
jgi:hypothetical protein